MLPHELHLFHEYLESYKILSLVYRHAIAMFAAWPPGKYLFPVQDSSHVGKYLVLHATIKYLYFLDFRVHLQLYVFMKERRFLKVNLQPVEVSTSLLVLVCFGIADPQDF